MSNKRALRRRMREIRHSQSAAETAILSAEITQSLLRQNCVQDAQCIMAYYPHEGEVDLLAFLQEWLDENRQVALPRIVHHGAMAAVQYTFGSAMGRNRHGIYEPESKTIIDPDQIDVVIVPALALGEDLHRIGYGGGYYDRYLQNMRAVKIGVAFDFQIVPHLPKHSHDVPLDMIISEKRTIGEAPCV